MTCLQFYQFVMECPSSTGVYLSSLMNFEMMDFVYIYIYILSKKICIYIYVYIYIYTYFFRQYVYVGIHSLTTWVGLFVFTNILSGHQGSSTIQSLHNHTFRSLSSPNLWLATERARPLHLWSPAVYDFKFYLFYFFAAYILIYFVNISTYLILSMLTSWAGWWVLCSSRFETTLTFKAHGTNYI